MKEKVMCVYVCVLPEEMSSIKTENLSYSFIRVYLFTWFFQLCIISTTLPLAQVHFGSDSSHAHETYQTEIQTEARWHFGCIFWDCCGVGRDVMYLLVVFYAEK